MSVSIAPQANREVGVSVVRPPAVSCGAVADRLLTRRSQAWTSTATTSPTSPSAPSKTSAPRSAQAQSTSSTARPPGCAAPAGNCPSKTARGGRQRRTRRQLRGRPGLTSSAPGGRRPGRHPAHRPPGRSSRHGYRLQPHTIHPASVAAWVGVRLSACGRCCLAALVKDLPDRKIARSRSPRFVA
jgi:hypothetical protein